MHDAGALFTADAGEVSAEMVQKRVNKGAGVRAGGRMHDHACGFVHDEQVVIFEDDVEGDVFGEGFHVNGVGDRNIENVAYGHLGFDVGEWRAVFGDSAFGNQTCKARTAEVRGLWHIAGERLIKARRRGFADSNAMDGL